MNTELKIAGIQTDVVFGDVSANLGTMESHLKALADESLFLVAFPECFLSGYCYSSLEAARENAITLEDDSIRQICQWARDYDRHLVFGFLQREDPHVYNSCGLATRQGDFHVYQKVHLPMLGVDQFTTPGKEMKVVDIDGVRIGLNICYDCSFPEPARLLGLQDVDLIVLPTNWPPGASDTADCIPNARALENNIYYMAVNRIGQEGEFEFIGKSKICHPEGYHLAFANHDQPAVLVADFCPQVAREKHRVRVPGKHEIHRFADRRPEIYGDISRPLKTERS